MAKANWKENKLEHLEYFYGKAYKQFKSEDVHDDRRVYVNIYEMIVEALKSIENEPNNYVCVAMNTKIKADLDILRRIGKRFGRTDYIFRYDGEY